MAAETAVSSRPTTVADDRAATAAGNEVRATAAADASAAGDLTPADGLSQEAGGQEAKAAVEVSISELHVLLQELLRELFRTLQIDAGAGLPSTEATAESQQRREEHASALLDISRRFEACVRSLPCLVRADGGELQEEVRRLQQEDEQLRQEVEGCTAELQNLEREVAARVWATCEQLCGGAVTVRTAKKEEAPQPAVSSAASAVKSKARKGGPPVPRLEDLVQDQSRRFAEELEFLQCLANPEYVSWLADQFYLEDPRFIEFLRYLCYWRDPPYVYHLVYPQALRMLAMLLHPPFRARLRRKEAQVVLSRQMMRQWAFAAEVPLVGVDATLSSPAAGLGGAGEEAQAEEGAGVLQGSAVSTGLPAEGACHANMGSLGPDVRTIQQEAEFVGRENLAKTFTGPELDAAFAKYRHLWSCHQGGSDMAQILKTPIPAAVPLAFDIPAGALGCLAASPVAASGSDVVEFVDANGDRVQIRCLDDGGLEYYVNDEREIRKVREVQIEGRSLVVRGMSSSKPRASSVPEGKEALLTRVVQLALASTDPVCNVMVLEPAEAHAGGAVSRSLAGPARHEDEPGVVAFIDRDGDRVEIKRNANGHLDFHVDGSRRLAHVVEFRVRGPELGFRGLRTPPGLIEHTVAREGAEVHAVVALCLRCLVPQERRELAAAAASQPADAAPEPPPEPEPEQAPGGRNVFTVRKRLRLGRGAVAPAAAVAEAGRADRQTR